MDIQQLDNEILAAKEALKKLRQYKRLLLKIAAEKAEIATLETAPLGDTPPEAPITAVNDLDTTTPAQTDTTAPVPDSTPNPDNLVLFPHDDLSNLTIRQLKALASSHKIPRYGRLTKDQLIAALAVTFPLGGWGLAA
ncbi:Rho termination factor N-terminal domain-containing protein [Synechococcus sp. PCC 6312]|uniref:Rho termination factor N-terminal domain-containing protein n=1 Tax=Synechococcus sp. (strain ATCC 27167 / PCC 6312) TaxID=195253 RepID=UPI00029ED7F7|nr:Rho termination factor N-terminal domain-containing protein [Synechococcus sp. PCC 6312]AFY60352.1 transcription termination factor [Synechococcus sp. PCC 6312]